MPRPAADGVRERTDRITLLAFCLSVLFGAGNPIAIRQVSCETCELEPFFAAASRFLLAAAILAVVALVARAPFPRGRGLAGALLFGALQFGAGFACIYYGYAHTPAGLGQVLLATVPLLTFVLAIVHRQERFRWDGLVGSMLAIAGIAAVFGSGLDQHVPVASMLAILLGAVFWAEALIVVRAFPPAHPAALNAVAMATGTLVLVALGLISSETWTWPTEQGTWLAQSYLVIVGGVLQFWLYVFILRGWSASAASYQLVLIPIVVVALGAWLLDERLTWTFAIGAVLVLGGVYVGALRSRGRERAVSQHR